MTLQVLDFLPALLVALGGSLHCAGMCGGFVLAAGAGRHGGSFVRTTLFRQLLYHAGKTTTYLFLGALAGLGGEAVARTGETWFRLLVLAAGLLLAAIGLHALGWLPLRWRTVRPAGARRGWLLRFWEGWARWGRWIFNLRSPLSPLFLGSFSGFLPCPLVYAFLAGAAATGSVPRALAVMGALGLGTIPVLVSVALGGMAVAPVVRLRLTRLGGVLLVALAVYTCYRGWSSPPCCGASG